MDESTASSSMATLLQQHRKELLARWLEKLRRTLPSEGALAESQLIDSFELYLDGLIETFRVGDSVLPEKSSIAREHGGQRHTLRRPIEDVVREYHLFFEAVIEIAIGLGRVPTSEDCVRLSRYLNRGTAAAAAEYARHRDSEVRTQQLEHFAFVTHEVRNPLNSASLAWNLLKAEGLLHGPLADRMERSLNRIASVVDSALVDIRVRLASGSFGLREERVALSALLDEARADAEGEAEAKQVTLNIESAKPIVLRIDRRLMFSALSNVVRNAVKFSRAGGHVELRAALSEGHPVIEIEDSCGGLEPQVAERVFEAFQQSGHDRSGFGLGLALALEAVELHKGTISVQNRVGKGCVFRIELPASLLEPSSS